MILVIVVVVGMAACGIAQPAHVKPSVDDCQRALIQIDADMNDVIAAVVSLKLEDSKRGIVIGHPELSERHIPEWWDAKLALLRSIASIASSVGRK